MYPDLDDKQILHILRWNRRWMSLLIVLALLVVAIGLAGWVIGNFRAVHATWNGDTLQVTSMTGPLLITHLVAYLPGNGPIAAALPKPGFNLDSAPLNINKKEFEALKWQYEGGGEAPRPPIGTKVSALFLRLEHSD